MQVWEDSAAAHVSLAENLGQVAALAQRWRKLELESWRRMLTIAEENHAACKSTPDTILALDQFAVPS